MAFNASVFQILIASPSDVRDERAVAQQLIHRWNTLHAVNASAVMLPVMWETHGRPDAGSRPQAIINEQLADNCDALIGIFWTRIGTPTGEAESGSVEEIERAIAAGKPTMLYFSSRPVVPDNLDTVQWERLKSFRERCMRLHRVEMFDSLEDLRTKLLGHLINLGQSLAGVQPSQSPIGLGQYPGMVYQMVSHNQAGWDFIRSHGLP